MEPLEGSHVSFTGPGRCQIQSFRAFLIGKILYMPQQQNFPISLIHTADQRVDSLLSFLANEL
jgi:hypothetical protein